MKRFIFFLLMLAGVAGSTYLILFDKQLFGVFTNLIGGASGVTVTGGTGFDLLKIVFEAIKAGTWKWNQFNSSTILVYGMAISLLINAVLLITLAFMLLLNFGRFSKVMKFYSISIWYFVSTLIFTGVFGYFLYDTLIKPGLPFMDLIKNLPWQNYVPIGSAILLMILGLIFKRSENDL